MMTEKKLFGLGSFRYLQLIILRIACVHGAYWHRQKFQLIYIHFMIFMHLQHHKLFNIHHHFSMVGGLVGPCSTHWEHTQRFQKSPRDRDRALLGERIWGWAAQNFPRICDPVSYQNLMNMNCWTLVQRMSSMGMWNMLLSWWYWPVDANMRKHNILVAPFHETNSQQQQQNLKSRNNGLEDLKTKSFCFATGPFFQGETTFSFIFTLTKYKSHFPATSED